MKNIRKQFPVLKANPKLAYLDSAASTLTPNSVIEKINDYYKKYRSNVHRGVYKISEEATLEYENARAKVAHFLNAEHDEVIFTSGVTMSLNMLAHSLCKDLSEKDNIVLTRMEHHANLVPWQEMSKKYGFEIRFIELESNNIEEKENDFNLDLKDASQKIDKNTKVVSFCHISNALGTISPIKPLIKMSQSVGATTIIDAAQTLTQFQIDVKKFDCDFLTFSGHKIYGPTGIGVLYGKKEKLEKIDPIFFGGDMINEVTYESSTFAELPNRLEAGTPNIAGAIGLGAAVDFVNSIGYDYIWEHSQELSKYLLNEIEKIDKVKLVGTIIADRGLAFSFVIDGVHPHDIASILDRNNVAVRAGHHCTMPLMKYLGINGTARASLGIYNNKKDIDQLVKGIKEVIKTFE